MKVMWRKTYHVYGYAEVSEPDDDETQQMQARDFAAAQDGPTMPNPAETPIEWAWTDFFNEVKKEDQPEGFVGIYQDDKDGTQYDEWFDI